MTLDATLEAELRTTLRALVADTENGLGAALGELGWAEVVAECPEAAALPFDELGRAARASALVDRLALERLGGQPGDLLVRPVPARHASPAGRVVGGVVEVDGWTLDAPLPGQRLVLSTGTDTVIAEFAGGLTVEPTQTIDPDSGWMHLHGTAPPNAVTADPGGTHWAAAGAACRLGAATELAGLGHGALALAVTHVRDRAQFGRPIGVFQAVRHRLAGAYATLAGADALVASAWTTRHPHDADAALAYATRAHRAVLAECQQVSGAMGLTWEHDLHRYLRRGFALAALFGPADLLIREIGARVLTTGVAV
jgi:hypothetical protein